MNITNPIIHTNNVKGDLFYMNKKKIRNYQIFSTIFVCILGILLHFTYELSGGNLHYFQPLMKVCGNI